jgi:RNA recognition motif-containing protein
MSNTLYIGGLSCQTTESELRDLVSRAGTIHKINLVRDKITGKSEGFGFVTMATESDTGAAISILNGKILRENVMVAGEARLPEERPAVRVRPVISEK